MVWFPPSGPIPKAEFYKRISDRLLKYGPAIAREQGGLLAQITSTAAAVTNRLRSLESTHKLLGDGFWGYGINDVCDGNVEAHQVDVSRFREFPDLNKHADDRFRLFWLLTFRADLENLEVSLFCVNVVTGHLNSDLHTRYKLTQIRHARTRVRGSLYFVDVLQHDAAKNISFQVDSRGGETQAQYYVHELTRLIEAAHAEKLRNQPPPQKEFFTHSEQALYTDLLNHIISALERLEEDVTVLKAGNQVLYEDAMDEFEDLKTKFEYGKKDWLDLVAVKLAKYGLNTVLEKGLWEPFVEANQKLLSR